MGSYRSFPPVTPIPKNKESKEEKLKLRVKSKPEREPETKENRQPKKFGFWKWLLG